MHCRIVDPSLGSQGKPPEGYLSNNEEYLSQVNSGIIQVIGRKGKVSLQEGIAYAKS